LIWLCLKRLKTDSGKLLRLFSDHGVIVSPGNYYYLDKPEDHHIRLSIAALDEHEIETGIERLGKALDTIYGSRQP
jgi:DNA-binding transcriptional MocR family regulator